MITSKQLVDTIVGALGRDERLRRVYLQRRWQGRDEAASSQHSISRARVAPFRARETRSGKGAAEPKLKLRRAVR